MTITFTVVRDVTPCVLEQSYRITSSLRNLKKLSNSWLTWLTASRLFSKFSDYQLNAQLFYSSTICMLHYAPQHVSSSTLLILRRTNCITTASGIVTLQTAVQYAGGERTAVRSPPAYCMAVYRGWRYQRLWWYNLSSWEWAACCSKHVEGRSVTYILLKNKRIVH